jgi:hypothetical protein
MAKSVFKHQDDGNDLSIFATKDLILVSCSGGHYWVLPAEQHTQASIKAAIMDRTESSTAVAALMADLDIH